MSGDSGSCSLTRTSGVQVVRSAESPDAGAKKNGTAGISRRNMKLADRPPRHGPGGTDPMDEETRRGRTRRNLRW